jgi:predicted ribosome quality control (RQC) complex YloA/Tae2 family protein
MPAAPTPKDRFSSLDTLALVRELRSLVRARVDKAFDLPAGGWSLVLRMPGVGRFELVLVPGRYAALLREGVTHLDELSRVAKELRRLLTGAALQSVAEPRGERFLELEFGRTGDATELRVAVELFGAGNLVVAEGERIAAVAQPRQWAHRTVRVGSPYERPPSRSDPWTLSKTELEAEIARSRTDLASTLAARLSLGGPVAEELVARGGWDGSESASGLAGRVGSRIHAEMQALLSEVGDKPEGHLYLREGVAVDATPYASRRWERQPGATALVRPTFSEAAHEYFASLVAPPLSQEEAAAAKARRDLEHQIDQQQKAVEGLGQAVAGLKAQAEAIFSHYEEAEAALAEAQRREGEESRVEVKLGEQRVPLYRDRSPRESAQALYEEAKRAQTKLDGARLALLASERRREAPRPVATPPTPGAAQPRPKPRWFERYRWFISSEGAVVIAGRDASSNDVLVRRHLKDGDYYVHADLHGAASVVVKHPAPGEPTLTEVTLREAAQWAIAFSKAWRAGLASASAFWVTPEQVSKGAASGEFVARGAWVIHGTKHVLRDLPLELALGTVRYGGEERWTVAPPSAVRALGAVRVLLVPGDERLRAEREVELAKEVGLSRTLLQSLLPAGGIEVRRP